MLEKFFQILAPLVVICGICESDDIHAFLELEGDARTDDFFAFLKGPWIILCSRFFC